MGENREYFSMSEVPLVVPNEVVDKLGKELIDWLVGLAYERAKQLRMTGIKVENVQKMEVLPVSGTNKLSIVKTCQLMDKCESKHFCGFNKKLFEGTVYIEECDGVCTANNEGLASGTVPYITVHE